MSDDTFFSGRTAWIIGASSGIGASTAQEMTRRGARVAISARRREALEEVSAGSMTVIPADASDAASVASAWDDVVQQLGVPDIVLFCAGFWEQTEKGTFDSETFAKHLDVHLKGLGYVLDHAVPAFVSRETTNGRRPVIASVASVAGYRGVPGGEYYGAVKAAQINLLEALRGSLAPRGVDVVTICPGFVKTDLTQGNSFPMPFIISPERAANEICDGLATGKPEIVFPKRMMAAMKAARLLPVSLYGRLAARAGR